MDRSVLKKREEIPGEFQWRLEDMFATDEEWEQEYDLVMKIAEDIKCFAGTLSESGSHLLAYYKMKDELTFHLTRVIVYANQRSHQDTKVSKYQGYVERADNAAVTAQSATAFADPEILQIPELHLFEMMEDEPELLAYERVILELMRHKAHVLSDAEEKILAKAGEIAVGPGNIYSMFNNADIYFHSVRDVEGNRIPVTHGNFTVLLKSRDRGIRRQAFEKVYEAYRKWGNTVAATFISHLKQEHFFAEVRKYPSVRAMHMDQGNIPESVYDNLIETVHAHLPAMYRYVALRKKLLGVNHLHMYDLYVPIVESVDREYTFEEAKLTVLKALEPMGKDYEAVLLQGFENRWIDVYENENKRTGAYSWGAYGTHPYVLLNYQNDLSSVFTLAHEMGHALHTYYSDKNQPVTYAEYLIFVAEVASTCNEGLLMHYLLEQSSDKKEKLYLLNHYLEEFRATVFRQTMFAEFEQIVHSKVAAGESLTREALNQIYHDLNVLYFGPDIIVDEEIDYEWMRIPHFYTSFYVYQYATGFSAATAFSRKILEEGEPAVEAYVKNFLSGGCSKDPIDLLKDAGVDMSTSKPISDALEVFEAYLEELEQEYM